jgi:hypothetical protein
MMDFNWTTRRHIPEHSKDTFISKFNFIIKHHAMKAYGGNGGISAPFLTSALDGM